MARETRLLLGLLGLLAGLFVGVVSLKLLVPRPPLGAGPDVHGDVAFTVRQALVPPPMRGPRAADFAAAPPLIGAQSSPDPFGPATQGRPATALAEPARFMPVEPPASRFATAPPAADLEPLDEPTMTADSFVQQAAFAAEASPRQEPAADGSRFPGRASDGAEMDPALTVAGPLDDPAVVRPVTRFGAGAGNGPDGPGVSERTPRTASANPFPVDRATAPIDTSPRVVPPPADPFTRMPAPAPIAPAGLPQSVGPIAGGHVVAGGDSWWSLAERAYGDGRLYRALYAWNRARDPRVALVPGTSLEIPPVERLAASWPALVPAAR